MRLVRGNIKKNYAWAADYPIWRGRNPYGDGKASIRIVNDIEKFLKKRRKHHV